MANHHPDYSSLYANMGIIAAKLAREKGTLSPTQAKIIAGLLKGAKHEHAK
jgi:hypothetical protein